MDVVYSWILKLDKYIVILSNSAKTEYYQLESGSSLLLNSQSGYVFYLNWVYYECEVHEDTFFSTLHPLSPVIFATATEVALVLLRSSMFNFHCYTQCEASPTQKSARKWHCNLSRLLVLTITMGIHSCKPASLNCPIHVHWQIKLIMCSIWVRTWCVCLFFFITLPHGQPHTIFRGFTSISGDVDAVMQ